MKTINKIMTTLCLMTLVLSSTSCLKDKPLINWSDMKSVIELPYKSHYKILTHVVPDHNEEFKLMVNYTIPYASDNKEDIPVRLGVDESLVETYNATNADEKQYELLPASAYTIPDVVIAKGTQYWEKDMIIKTDMLSRGKYYLLPIVIVEVPANYIISGNFGYVYLKVQMSD